MSAQQLGGCLTLRRCGIQAFIDPIKHPEYVTASSSIRAIIREGGVLNLWAGLAPRLTRVVGAAFILNGTRNKAIEVVEDYKTRPGRA